MKVAPPSFEDLSTYYREYWKYLSGNDLIEALENQSESVLTLINQIPANKEDFRYAEGKWMVKELIGHLIDVDRILSYRALRFARNDQTALASFDEDQYMLESNFKSRSLKDIALEWNTVRKATLSLFVNLDAATLDRTGIAGSSQVSPRIILYFILVHEHHHIEILKNRYLSV